METEDTRKKADVFKLNAKVRELVAREQGLGNEIDRIIAKIEVEA